MSEIINYSTFSDYYGMASVFKKVNIYNNRSIAVMESNGNNPDIRFSVAEQLEIKAIFEEILEHLNESMMNESLMYDEIISNDVETLNEGLKDWVSKKLDVVSDSISGAAKKLGDKVQITKDDISSWAKETKENALESYKTAIEFVEKLIKKGIDSVKDFIKAIGEMFSKLGKTLSEALNKLGAFKFEDEEEEVSGTWISKAFMSDINDDEKEFFNYVYEYVQVMTGSHKDRVQKILSESDNFEFDFSSEMLEEGVVDKIANNKVMQFILCYGKDKKVSFWKTILISITGSLIIAMALPMFLDILGLGAASAVIGSAVSFMWNCKGILRILLGRYVNKKPGEKFFNKAVTIALIISGLTLAVFQMPPVKDALRAGFEDVVEHMKSGEPLDGVDLSVYKPETEEIKLPDGFPCRADDGKALSIDDVEVTDELKEEVDTLVNNIEKEQMDKSFEEFVDNVRDKNTSIDYDTFEGYGWEEFNPHYEDAYGHIMLPENIGNNIYRTCCVIDHSWGEDSIEILGDFFKGYESATTTLDVMNIAKAKAEAIGDDMFQSLILTSDDDGVSHIINAIKQAINDDKLNNTATCFLYGPNVVDGKDNVPIIMNITDEQIDVIKDYIKQEVGDKYDSIQSVVVGHQTRLSYRVI